MFTHPVADADSSVECTRHYGPFWSTLLCFPGKLYRSKDTPPLCECQVHTAYCRVASRASQRLRVLNATAVTLACLISRIVRVIDENDEVEFDVHITLLTANALWLARR